MKVCIIIGFNYNNQINDDKSKDRTFLPGIIVDLYQAYKLAKQMKSDKIIIITDIIKDSNTKYLMNAMIKATVDANILTFIEQIKKEGIYYCYINNINLIDLVLSVINDCDKLFFYYTGHMIDGNILFPHNNIGVSLVKRSLLNSGAKLPSLVKRSLLNSGAKLPSLVKRSLLNSGAKLPSLVKRSLLNSGAKLPSLVKRSLLKSETKLPSLVKRSLLKSETKLPSLVTHKIPVKKQYNHGIEDELCIQPDLDKMDIIIFKNIILSKINEKAQIFMILDCCNINGCNLPYKMIDGIYRLTKGNLVKRSLLNSGSPSLVKRSLLNSVIPNFSTQEIICFSSTMPDEKSITSYNGSVFTRILFKYLNKIRNIKELLKKIKEECLNKYQQTVTIYSSYPNLQIIWNWLYCSNKLKIKIMDNLIMIETEK